MPIDSHAVAERANLIRHRLYAEVIEKDPSLIQQALDMILRDNASGHSTFGTRIWAYILTKEPEQTIQYMLDPGQVGQLRIRPVRAAVRAAV